MTTALQRRDNESIIITDEQVDLIRKTVAKDATPQELQLYFYDCQRRGVHPLDKLIHFTKRGGKYTPIVSIDYMRSQAAETGEYAGNQDAIFRGELKAKDFAATVTVQRIVKGLVCSFTATARWSEYSPGSNKMYDSMPHTMLAKCAEALALRKGFPQQLSGLYTREEMEQAGEDTTVRNVTPTAQAPARVLQLPSPNPQPVETQTLPLKEIAQRLVDINAVSRTADGYTVTTGEGTRLIQKINGKVGCNCDGFIDSTDPDYQCAHIVAAYLYAKQQQELDAKAAAESA